MRSEPATKDLVKKLSDDSIAFKAVMYNGQLFPAPRVNNRPVLLGDKLCLSDKYGCISISDIKSIDYVELVSPPPSLYEVVTSRLFMAIMSVVGKIISRADNNDIFGKEPSNIAQNIPRDTTLQDWKKWINFDLEKGYSVNNETCHPNISDDVWNTLNSEIDVADFFVDYTSQIHPYCLQPASYGLVLKHRADDFFEFYGKARLTKSWNALQCLYVSNDTFKKVSPIDLSRRLPNRRYTFKDLDFGENGQKFFDAIDRAWAKMNFNVRHKLSCRTEAYADEVQLKERQDWLRVLHPLNFPKRYNVRDGILQEYGL